MNFDILDFPGQIDFFDSSAFDAQEIFGNCGALVFVIDVQEDDHFDEALKKLHQTVTRAYKVNKNIKFEVFIHKVDSLSDDHKIGARVLFIFVDVADTGVRRATGSDPHARGGGPG